MKKITALIFTVVLAVGSAFADHPSGWGIGVVGTYGIGVGYGGGGPGVGLSLKIPAVPVFWGIGAGFGTNYFSLDVTGDYYLIDKPLVSEANLHWFWGVGGFFDFYRWSDNRMYGSYKAEWSYTNVYFGVRMPIGVSWQPISWFELFLNGAPNLGVDIYSGWSYEVGGQKYSNDGKTGLYFAIPVNLGIRFWI